MLPGRVRRLARFLLICCILASFMYVGYLNLPFDAPKPELVANPGWKAPLKGEGPVTVVVVLCARPNSAGSSDTSIVNGVERYLRQLKVLIKSLLFSEREHQQERGWTEPNKETLELIIFSDHKAIWDAITRFMETEVNSAYRSLVRIVFERVTYPKEFTHIKNLVHPCTTFRLFLPQALPKHDTILYVDTDVVFTRHAGVVYSEASQFNDTQWCGMAPDWYHELPGSVPFYGAQGLNAGVGVYNLTRMRTSAFLDEMPSIYKEHTAKLQEGGDQGFLNIYFHNRPHEVRQLPCEHNFIPLHCIKSPLCGGALHGSGIAIAHGCWQGFFKNKPESQFSILFNEYEKLELRDVVEFEGFRTHLRERLEENRRRLPEIEKSLSPDNTWYETGCTRNDHFLHTLFGDNDNNR